MKPDCEFDGPRKTIDFIVVTLKPLRIKSFTYQMYRILVMKIVVDIHFFEKLEHSVLASYIVELLKQI